MKRLVIACLLLYFYYNFCFAEMPDKPFQWQATQDHSIYAPIGQVLPKEMVNTTSGIKNLSELLGNEISLIAVRDPDCPISRRYAGKLKQFHRDGLQIIYLLTGQLATKEIAQKDQNRHNINGLYILDKDRKLSTWLGVETSAEVYLFDRNSILRYRGAIDDQYGIGFSRNDASQTFLINALDSVRSNKKIKLVATSAPGCIIRQSKSFSSIQNVTWHNDIYPLIKEKCQSCHRPGQAGPFSLETYQQVYARKEMIRFVLENKIMPPWSLTSDSNRFVNNEKYLADSDRKKIIDWIDAGAIKGKNITSNTSYTWTTGWKYGQPDVILTSPSYIDVQAEGEIAYKYVSIPTNFETDRWVRTIEVATETPENTHHIILFVLPPIELIDKFMPGSRNKTDLNRKELHQLALKGFFSGYIPGLPGVTYENNSAKLLPKGWRIVMQIHHQSNGKQVKDRPRVGLQFLHTPPKKVINTLAATNIDLLIPAGKANHLETANYQFKENGEIVGLYPHMHLRGSAFKYELIQPNGLKETLLDIPSYDPNWQQYYQFQEPIIIKKGTTLVVSGWFDNSKNNLNNPDPTTDVKFGLRTQDEMMIGYFDWVATHASK